MDQDNMGQRDLLYDERRACLSEQYVATQQTTCGNMHITTNRAIPPIHSHKYILMYLLWVYICHVHMPSYKLVENNYTMYLI